MKEPSLTTSCHRLDQCISVLTLILESQQHSPLHEAETFSQLLCVNKRMRAALLRAGVGRITLRLTMIDLQYLTCDAEAEAARSLVRWLHQHLRLQTLCQVDCLPDLVSEPIWRRRGEAWFWCEFDEYYVEELAFLSRITIVLAAAHAILGPRTPVVKRWFGTDGS